MTLQTRTPENFRYCRWGADRRVSRAQTRERGPPSALAEISSVEHSAKLFIELSPVSFVKPSVQSSIKPSA